jgi:hypothetical protein
MLESEADFKRHLWAPLTFSAHGQSIVCQLVSEPRCSALQFNVSPEVNIMIRAHTQSGQKQQTGGCNPGAVAMVFEFDCVIPGY